MNDLRGQVTRALDQLASDILCDHHGDPHAGFVVLVYPDREPEVVYLREGTNYPVRQMMGAPDVTSDEEAEKAGVERLHGFWTDSREASHALSDARLELQLNRGEKRGEAAAEYVAKMYRARIDHELERQVKQVEYDRLHAAQCPHCKQRYSVKGLATHLRLAAWCSKEEARVQELVP